MNKNIIWVMDSDLCEGCGELLNDWGICDFCGWSDTFGFDEEEGQDDGIYDEEEK